MIEFVGVSKWYGQVSALTDVTFEIPAGVTGLVGANGAGKSTLIKLVAGLLRPSQGIVLIDGQSPEKPSSREILGYCPDIDQFYERMTGCAFVTWMLRLSGDSGGRAKRRAQETLERLGLGDAMHRPIQTYSKGMRQRVKLAQALGHNPRIVLLDEPMTGLDPVARHEFVELVADLGREGVAVLISSHVLHELESIAERVLFVHQGRLMAEGSVEDLRKQLDDRPLRLLLRSKKPRELAAELMALKVVAGVDFYDDRLEISTVGSEGLYLLLTELGAAGDLLDEIVPLDADLESVFGYLIS